MRQGSFGHIAVHMDKRILVALALDTALTLGKISRSPRAVQVMQRHKTVLHIGACAHFGGAAQQDAHLSSADPGKQFFLLHLSLGFVDKSNLLGGHSLGDELLADVLIAVSYTHLDVYKRQIHSHIFSRLLQ